MNRPQGDDLLLRKAARRLGLQTAVLVGAAMLLLVVAVGVVVVRGQQQATDDLLRSTVATADDVDDPPPNSWIVLTTTSGSQASPGLPKELESGLAALRAGSLTAGVVTISFDDRSFRVLTRARDGLTVQAVFDVRSQHEERDRLVRVTFIAGAASLLLAAAIGAVLGRRSARPLADALALQRSFVADASHELKTPLTLLSTRVQLLERELTQAEDQVRADAAGVVHDVHRLGEVVDDLLVAADPRRDDERSPVELAELVAAVVDSAGPHATAAGVQLEVAATENFVVRVAPVAVRRAILALVDNAIEHTPAGGEVRLAVTRRGSHAIVRVQDSGPGLPEGSEARLIRRFHSGGQRAGRAHYGLGLALTHDVANRHGGQLRFVPSDAGAVFELVLPL